jgi:DNA polymerase-3 subunit gamma/tau
VVDRCHRFDFSRPTIAQIASVVRRVAESEGITAPDDALALIARSATGSFRDALGTLEQLVAYSGTTIALEDVLAVLGAADDELLFGTVDAIAAGSARDALLAAARLADSGRDVARFFTDLEGHLRGLMIVQTLGSVPAELAMTPEADQRLLDQSGRVGPAAVTRSLELLAEGMRAMKDGADARTQLELALVKAADPIRDASQTALLSRLERLERGAPTAPLPVHAPDRPATPAGQARQQPAGPPQPAAPQTGTPHYGPPETPEPAAPPRPATPYGQPPPQAPQPVSASVPSPDGPSFVTAVPVEDEPTIAVAVEGELDLAAFREVWPAVLDQMKDTLMGALLVDAVPVALGGDSITIAFAESNDALHRQADRPANREAIKTAIRTVTGKMLALKLEKRADDELDIDDELAALSEDELIDRVVQEFDAVLEEEETQ